MMKKEKKTNSVELIGTAITDFSFDHSLVGENFYLVKLSVERFSGQKDIIRVLVSDFITDVGTSCIGKKLHITGTLRSYMMNRHVDKPKLILSVLASDLEFVDDDKEDMNFVELRGFLCKTPMFRILSFKKITDLFIAVNRSYASWKSDYIPVLAWNRNAYATNRLTIGDEIHLKGRLQSRDYQKASSPEITHTVNEVSVDYLQIISENKVKRA